MTVRQDSPQVNAQHSGTAGNQPGYDAADEYRPEPIPPPQPPVWMDGSLRIGIHTSIAGDIVESLERAHKLGCNALQIFSASPRMWTARNSQMAGTRVSPADAQRFRQRRAELSLGPFVIHDNYLVNLASPDRVLRARSIQALHDELVRALALGADFLVVHPGSSRDGNRQRAVRDIAQGLRQATRGLRLGNLRILLENTAGQGSMLGARFEELQAILRACPDLPLGVCLDTAHMFAAGYDIRSYDGLERTLEAVERTVGLKRLFIVHVNDSKTPLGSRVDRHEHIGAGRIGLEAFRRILNHPLLAPNQAGVAGRAFILETPIHKPGDDRRNVRTLWKLVGVDVAQLPGVEDSFTMRRKPAQKRVSHRAAAKKVRAKAARSRGVSTRTTKKPSKR